MKKILFLCCSLFSLSSVCADSSDRAVVLYEPKREEVARQTLYKRMPFRLDIEVLQANMEAAFPGLFRGERYFQQTAKPFALTVQNHLRQHPDDLIVPGLKGYTLKVRSYIETLLEKHPQVQFFLDEIDLKLESNALSQKWLSFLGLRLQAAVSKPTHVQTEQDEKEESERCLLKVNWQDEEEVLADISELFDGVPYSIHVPMYGYSILGVCTLIRSYLQNIYPYAAEDIGYQTAHGSLYNAFLLADHDVTHGRQDYEDFQIGYIRALCDELSNRGSGDHFFWGIAQNDLARNLIDASVHKMGEGVFQKHIARFAAEKILLIREIYKHLFKLYVKNFANPRDMQIFSRVMVAFFERTHESGNHMSIQKILARDLDCFFVKPLHLFMVNEVLQSSVEEEEKEIRIREHTFLREAALALGSGWTRTGFFKIAEARDNLGLLQMAWFDLVEPEFTGDDARDYPVAKAYLTEVQKGMKACDDLFQKTAQSLIHQPNENGETLAQWFARKNAALEAKYNKILQEAMQDNQ